MVTLWHEEQKISTDVGLLPATLPKVDSAFHSPDGNGKMSSRACGAPWMAAIQLNSTSVITCDHLFIP